jgi:hypothetical protein
MRKEEIKIPTGSDWRQVLVAQLIKIQNQPKYRNQDIMTFSGFCEDRHELWNYVRDRAAA